MTFISTGRMSATLGLYRSPRKPERGRTIILGGRKTAKALAKFYKLRVRSAHYHNEGNWYWNLKRFPGAYFRSKRVHCI